LFFWRQTFFNLVKIHLLFRIMILIQWSVNISVFVNHVVIVFWGTNEGDRKRIYIYTPCYLPVSIFNWWQEIRSYVRHLLCSKLFRTDRYISLPKLDLNVIKVLSFPFVCWSIFHSITQDCAEIDPDLKIVVLTLCL
jgi:hypothetical protein